MNKKAQAPFQGLSCDSWSSRRWTGWYRASQPTPSASLSQSQNLDTHFTNQPCTCVASLAKEHSIQLGVKLAARRKRDSHQGRSPVRWHARQPFVSFVLSLFMFGQIYLPDFRGSSRHGRIAGWMRLKSPPKLVKS